MGLKISVNNPALPKGEPLDIGGLLVENGGTVTLTEEQEQALVNRVGMAVKDYFKDSEDFKVEGTATVKTSEAPTEEQEEGGET
jgi:hypothetical protein